MPPSYPINLVVHIAWDEVDSNLVSLCLISNMSAVKVCHFCGINSLKQKKIKGKYDKALDKSVKEMKVTSGKHIGGTAMTGAMEKNS